MKKYVLLMILAVLLLTAGWLAFDRYVDRSGWIEKDGIYGKITYAHLASAINK